MIDSGTTTGVVLQISIDEFDLILTILGIAGVSFAAWLYRHERWFRDRVFPVLQILTGKSPEGEDLGPTNAGYFEETEHRFEKLEKDTKEAKEVAKEALEVAKETQNEVGEVADKQERYQEQNESILRAILSAVDGVDDGDIDRPLFRGGDRGGDDGHATDGGRRDNGRRDDERRAES